MKKLLCLLLAMGLLLLSGCAGDQPVSSAPTEDTTTVTTTTTTTVTTTTTTTTAAPTTKKPATTTQSRELLAYDTTGRFVQAPDGAYAGPWNLMLVNDWNPMPEDYEAGVTFVKSGHQQVDKRIQKDLNAMLEAGKAHGIGVQSGYRSAAHQGTLYWRQVNYYSGLGYNDKAAQTAAGKVVKRPGYSEHNTGLAVDLGGSGNFKLEMDFENTAAFRWLMENCAEYGFILRFPKGKESITGVIYEPWHYRYVGVEAAREIMKNNLCLEEYLEQKAAEA